MLRRGSILARGLEPLAGMVWPVFVGWTCLVALLWISGVDGEPIAAGIANRGLRDALLAIVHAADFVWLLLGAVILYLALAERVGLTTARLWAMIIFATASVIALASVYTGWPLGSIFYTARLGGKLGPLPMGWPLWWFVAVIGSRMLAERCWPRASHHRLAAATGVLAALSQVNLEPLASKVRLFWHWYERGTHLATTNPLSSYLTWWLAATGLAFLLREPRVAAHPRPPSFRPLLVLPLLNAVFLLTHLAMALRG